MPSLSRFFRPLGRAAAGLGRTPGFTLAAVLTLSLGMGGALALFSALYGAVLRTPPYPHAERIFQVDLGSRSGSRSNLSALQVREYAASSPDVESVSTLTHAWGAGCFLETAEGRSRIPAVWVDAQAMPMLGIRPRLGAGFSEEHFLTGDGVLLTHGFWMEHFGGDPGVIGRSLPLLGKAQPILGVLPAGAEFPFHLEARLVRPLPPILPGRRGEYRFTGLVRLRPGADPRAVEAAFHRDAARQFHQFPRNNPEIFAPRLEPLKAALAGEAERGFWLLCGAAGLLFLLTLLNVAALFLDRAARREGDTAIRLGLGASARHLVLQSLPESLLVAGSAAGLGLLMAALMGRALRDWLPGGEALHGLDRAWAHPAVAAFAVALVLLTGAALGLLPLLQARSLRLEAGLRAGTSAGRSTHRVRNGLVVAQLALATLLLVGLGLLGHSLQRLMDKPLGFDPAGLVTVELEASHYGQEALDADPQPLLHALAERPGIRGAALCASIPGAWQDSFDHRGECSFNNWNGSCVNVSREAATLEDSEVSFGLESVSQDYFSTLGLPFREGRAFTAEELSSARRVCVIDEAAARKLFPEGALGRFLYVGAACDFDVPRGIKRAEPLEIVGVVQDFENMGAEQRAVPSVYLPATLLPPARLLLRTSLPPKALRAELDRLMGEQLPGLRVHALQGLQAQRWEEALPRRQVAALLLPFGLLALFLAALGLGTLLGSQIVQRTRELGLRAALGATPTRLLGSVVGRALRLVGEGFAGGLVLSFGLTRLLQSLLFGVPPGDPAVLLATLLGLLLTALTAAALPALRAARMDPAKALRSE